MSGYKVLKIYSDGSLHSPSISSGVGNVEYKINDITVPLDGCGPLCVFRDLPSAYKNAWGLNTVIVKCHYKKSTYRDIWYKHADGYISSSVNIPKETVLCDEVIIVI